MVSIVIPTYNRASIIAATLDSIINQNYKNWECLIIDDGSTDNTEELLDFYSEKDERFIYVKRPGNLARGANSCRNYGFQLSKGNYINWFDSDDLMHPDKLRMQVEQLNNSPIDFSVCESLVFLGTPDNILGKRHDRITSANPFEDYVKLRIGWLTQAPLFRRSFIKSLDRLFDVELEAAQEWEFYSRILAHSTNYKPLFKELVYLRQHRENITFGTAISSIEWNYFLARLKIYKNPDIKLSENLKNYLRDYLKGAFKNSVWKKDFQLAIKMYRAFLIKEKISPIKKLKAMLAILSFKYLNRGSVLLHKI